MNKARSTVARTLHEADNTKNTNAVQGIQVIARAASILRALKTNPDGLSLGQIAGQVDLPRSTVQRIVNALMTERLIQASATEGGLRLGPEIHSMAMASRLDVTDIVRPILTALSKATGETVDLAELRSDKLVFIDQVEGSHRLRTVSAVGDAFPLTDTANGKAVLAQMEKLTARRMIEQELLAVEQTVRTVDDVMQEIDTARECGYSLDCDEHTAGISAVGAAFSDQFNVLYAISIPVPSQRFPDKKAFMIHSLQAAVLQASELIS